MSTEAIKCLARLKSSLEAATQLSNPGKLDTVEALRSGIRIAVDAVDRELKYERSQAELASQNP
jgi:hypothetical protein